MCVVVVTKSNQFLWTKWKKMWTGFLSWLFFVTVSKNVCHKIMGGISNFSLFSEDLNHYYLAPWWWEHGRRGFNLMENKTKENENVEGVKTRYALRTSSSWVALHAYHGFPIWAHHETNSWKYISIVRFSWPVCSGNRHAHTQMNAPHLPGSSQSSQADAIINQHTAQKASNIDHRP